MPPGRTAPFLSFAHQKAQTQEPIKNTKSPALPKAPNTTHHFSLFSEYPPQRPRQGLRKSGASRTLGTPNSRKRGRTTGPRRSACPQTFPFSFLSVHPVSLMDDVDTAARQPMSPLHFTVTSSSFSRQILRALKKRPQVDLSHPRVARQKKSSVAALLIDKADPNHSHTRLRPETPNSLSVRNILVCHTMHHHSCLSYQEHLSPPSPLFQATQRPAIQWKIPPPKRPAGDQTQPSKRRQTQHCNKKHVQETQVDKEPPKKRQVQRKLPDFFGTPPPAPPDPAPTDPTRCTTFCPL